MTIDIPSIVASFFTVSGLTAMITAVFTIGKKSESDRIFKQETEDRFEEGNERFDKFEAKLDRQTDLLIRIEQNQNNHQRNDDVFFSEVAKRLDRNDENWRQTWGKK